MNKAQQIKTSAFGDLKVAKILVIGHDPRLNKSNTIAQYSFFANYFFEKIPSRQSEKKKYYLSKCLYSYLNWLTNFKFVGKEKGTYFITNLCNSPLIHAPPKKIVYIPEIEAIAGYKEIIQILDSSKINLIFSMSLQVNYWLQKLNLYKSNEDFLNLASPRSTGVESDPPYYENLKGTPFLDICLKEHQISRNGRSIRIIPVLHTKHWSLNNGFVSGGNSMRKYQEIYESYKNGLRNELFA